MRSIATRSAFVATLCAGVAMVGASVHGMLGVDAELQRSAVAAKERPTHTFRVSAPVRDRNGDCLPAPPWSKQRV
jgi:hypothetical protein